MPIVGVPVGYSGYVPSISTCSKTDGLGEVMDKVVSRLPSLVQDADTTVLCHAGFSLAAVPFPVHLEEHSRARFQSDDIPEMHTCLAVALGQASPVFPEDPRKANTVPYLSLWMASEMIIQITHAGKDSTLLFLSRPIRGFPYDGMEIVVQDNGVGIPDIPRVVEAGYGRVVLPERGRGFPKILDSICYAEEGELIVESGGLGFAYTFALENRLDDVADYILRRRFESKVRRGTRVSFSLMSVDGKIRAETIARAASLIGSEMGLLRMPIRDIITL